MLNSAIMSSQLRFISQTLNHNYQKIIGSIATIHWAWANHAITCIDYVISLTCYQFDQKKLIPIKYYNGDLLIKSTAIVMLPLSADTVNSFHPLRNKPAVWFTEDFRLLSEQIACFWAAEILGIFYFPSFLKIAVIRAYYKG